MLLFSSRGCTGFSSSLSVDVLRAEEKSISFQVTSEQVVFVEEARGAQRLLEVVNRGIQETTWHLLCHSRRSTAAWRQGTVSSTTTREVRLSWPCLVGKPWRETEVKVETEWHRRRHCQMPPRRIPQYQLVTCISFAASCFLSSTIFLSIFPLWTACILVAAFSCF